MVLPPPTSRKLQPTTDLRAHGDALRQPADQRPHRGEPPRAHAEQKVVQR